MIREHSVRLLLAATAVVWGAAQVSGAAGETTQSVTITPGVPDSATRIVVPLTASAPTDQYSGGYEQSRQISSQEMPARFQTYAADSYVTYFDLGKDLGGRSYYLLGRPRGDLNFLGQGHYSNPPLSVLVLRESSPGAEQFEAVTTGILNSGQSAEVPFRYTLPVPIGSNKIGDVSGSLRISVSGRSESQYTGNVSVRSALNLSGEVFLNRAKLSVKLTSVAQIPPASDQRIDLSLEPLAPDVPSRSTFGKLGDALTLGQVRLVVEEMAGDLSQLKLAVLHGDLDQAVAEQSQTVVSLPSLAQTELFERRVLSASDLLTSAAKSGWLVLIFGEFQQTGQAANFMMGGGGRSPQLLSMPPQATLQILAQGTKAGAPPPLVAFIVRSIDLNMLYADYLNSRPEFLVLSDFADPMRTQFRKPDPHSGGFISGGYQAPVSTLRQIMNFPDGKVSVAAFDSSGKARYVKPDVGDNLQGALLEVVNVMKTGAPPAP